MADPEEGTAAPNQRQGTKPTTKPAATESRWSRTMTLTYKLVKF